MSKSLVITILTGLILLLSVFVILVINSSLWFSWHLLPENFPIKFSVSVNKHFTHSLSDVTDKYLSEEMQSIINESSHISLAKEGNSLVAIVLPRAIKQLSLSKELTARGWQVDRVGVLLYAQKNTKGINYKLMPTIKQSMGSLVFSRWPVKPFAILKLDNNILPKMHGFDAIATMRGQKVNIYLSENNNTPKSLKFKKSNNSDLSIVFPGEVLSVLPRELKKNWNNILRKKFNFSHTNPSFIDYMSQFEKVTFSFNGKDTMIGVQGAQSAFFDTVQKWVQEENRYDKLKKKAFKLPDGTIGYEKVPGAAQAAFKDIGEGCWVSIAEKDKLWICLSEKYITFSTNRSVSQTDSFKTSSWSIAGKTGKVSEFCDHAEGLLPELLCQAMSWQVVGQSQGAAVTLELK